MAGAPGPPRSVREVRKRDEAGPGADLCAGPGIGFHRAIPGRALRPLLPNPPMSTLRSFRFVFLASVLLSAALAAQDISVSSTSVSVGDKLEITYSNRKLAGQTVEIEIFNGNPFEPVTLVYEVKLDANGKGTLSWSVEPWLRAEVSGPGTRDVGVAIL